MEKRKWTNIKAKETEIKKMREEGRTRQEIADRLHFFFLPRALFVLSAQYGAVQWDVGIHLMEMRALCALFSSLPPLDP